MADGFTDGSRPEGCDWNAATVAAFHHGAEIVAPGKAGLQFEHFIFAPLAAGSLKRPHLIGRSFYFVGIEAMTLRDNLVEFEVVGAGVFVLDGSECDIGR